MEENTEKKINGEVKPVEWVSDEFDRRKAEDVPVTMAGIEREFGMKPGQVRNFRSNRLKVQQAAAPGASESVDDAGSRESHHERPRDVAGFDSAVRTRRFPLDRVVLWDNARKFFGVDELKGLALSLRSTEGAIQDPFGYVKRVGDLRSPDDGTQWERLVADLDPEDEVCVLLGGERRFRATKLNADEGVPGFDGIWMKVIPEPERKRKFELNLTENTQRAPLKFSELAARFHSMLAERNEDGSKVWTQESFANNMGYDLKYVQKVLAASKAPARVCKALDAGTMPLNMGRMLGSLPREIAERAADEVAFGPAGMMTEAEAEGLIAREYRRELKTAVFGVDDIMDGVLNQQTPCGDRVPGRAVEDTSCRNCADFSGNREDMGGRTTCLNPSCFVMKQGVRIEMIVDDPENAALAPKRWTWERTVLANASDVEIWDWVKAEERRVFMGPKQQVSPESEFIDLADVPPGKLLTPEHRGSRSLPRWGKILEGEGLPVTVCFDSKGRVRLMVPLQLAVEAAKLSGFRSLFSGAAKNEMLTDEDKQAQARVESAVAAVKREVLVEGTAEFLKLASVEDDWDRSGVVRLIEAALEQDLKKDDLVFLCEVLDGPGTRPPQPMVRILEWADSSARSGSELLGFLAVVLQCRMIKLEGFGNWTGDDPAPCGVIAEGFGFSGAEWMKRLHQRAAAVKRSAEKAADAVDEGLAQSHEGTKGGEA